MIPKLKVYLLLTPFLFLSGELKAGLYPSLELDGQGMTFHEIYEQQTFPAEMERKIKAWFVEAAKHEESEKPFKAIRFYKKITDIAYEHDWSVLVTQSIAYSFLKLAEHFSDESSFYLAEASKFQTSKPLPKEAFSSSTLRKLKKSTVEKKSFPLLHQFGSPQVVKLNSRIVPIDEWARLKLPVSKFRLSVLSDSDLPFHFSGTYEELTQIQSTIGTINYGTCKGPKLVHPVLSQIAHRILYSEDCIFDFRDGILVRQAQSLGRKNLSSSDSPLPQSPSGKMIDEIFSTYAKASKKNISNPSLQYYKNLHQSENEFKNDQRNSSRLKKNLWIVFGVIATGLLIDNNSKNTKKTVYQ